MQWQTCYVQERKMLSLNICKPVKSDLILEDVEERVDKPGLELARQEVNTRRLMNYLNVEKEQMYISELNS